MSSPPRSSRFVEGIPLTRPDLLQRTATSNEFLLHILSETDAYEKRRQHSNSNASVESLGGEHMPTPVIGKDARIWGEEPKEKSPIRQRSATLRDVLRGLKREGR